MKLQHSNSRRGVMGCLWLMWSKELRIRIALVMGSLVWQPEISPLLATIFVGKKNKKSSMKELIFHGLYIYIYKYTWNPKANLSLKMDGNGDFQQFPM